MGSLSFSWTVRQPRRLREKRIRIIYVHLCVAICANLMDICKTGASCLDLKLEICLEDKNTAVQHWWDVNGVVTAAGLERGQWDVRAAGGQGTVGDARHPWGLLHSQTDSEAECKYLDLPAKLLCIWSLRALKENLCPACLSDTGRAEETDPEMFCTNMHVTINPMLTFVTFDFSYDVNSARIIPPPHELTIIFWTATGDKLCWALWVKSFIVVIFIVVSKTQDTSEIWGPVSFSPQVLWVYIYMETCSVSVSKYQDMLFTNGQHKWVRKKKKVFFLHQTVQLSAPSSSSGVPRQIKLCHRQEQRSVSMSGPPQGDSSHPPPSCCHNVA